MAQPPSASTGPHSLVLDADLIRSFAAATCDDTPAYVAGTAVPPTLLSTLIYTPQAASMNELLDPMILETMVSGVHGQHELLLHRPLEVGETLTGYVEAFALKPAKSNLRVTFRHPAFDAAGDLVAEQWWTTVLLGTTADAEGPDLADFTFADLDRSAPVAVDEVRIDAEMVQKYADVSKDYSDHHFTLEGAQRSGQPEVFLHGLCTMALAGRAAVRTVAGGDPRRIRRFAVRFGSPAFLDRQLVTSFYEISPTSFAFDGVCGDAPALRNGFVELR